MRRIFPIIIFLVFLGGNLSAQFKDEYYLTRYQQAKDSLPKKVQPKYLSPGKVCLMSAIVPGSGQIYNGQWYKAGALYAGMAAIIYFINFNEQNYVDFKQAYKQRTDNNPYTIDKYDTASHSGQPFISDPQTLIDYREYYHRNRDLLYILATVVFTANIIDAYVYAHLREFDISDKLSLEINLTKFSNIANGLNYTPSISLRF